MRSIWNVTMALILLAMSAARAADNTPPEGFTAIFNGKDLTNFKADDTQKKYWTLKDGVLDLAKNDLKPRKDLTIWTEKEYGDLTILIDWRWSGQPYKIKHPIILPSGEYKKDENGKVIEVEIDEAGDSGVYLRGNSKSQVNFWCWNTGSGEVYGYRTDAKMPPEVKAGVTPKKNMDKPYGEWNHMEITIKGDRLWVKENGEEVISNAQLPGVPAKGALAIQDHGNPCQFKNIYIKELK